MGDPAVAALNSLLRTSGIDDHDEALRLATAAIKAKPAAAADLLAAQHTRVVALLKLDRFDDALRAIAEGGASLEHQCALEKAYALYKTGELNEADAALRQATGGSGSGRALKHVAAQVSYRAERFDHAAHLYRELIEEEGGNYGEENDLKINMLATQAQLGWQGKGDLVPEKSKQPGREDLEAFETAYNAACGCLARGDFAKAAILLKRSRDLCEASEDLSDEEKKVELLPIIVQQVYVSTHLGKADEAASLQRLIKLADIPDPSTKVVAQSNRLTQKANDNPYLLQRLAESMPEVTGNDRLFEYQAAVLKRNKYIIQLQAQKFAGVKEKTASLLKDSPPSVSADKVNLGMLNAAATTQLKSGKEALRAILPLLDARPDDVGLLLTIIQLYIQTKNPGPALTLLEAFFKRLEAATTPDHEDVRYAPGLVALAVALYRLQGRHGATRTELAKAAAHWQKEAKVSSSSSLLREAGIELLGSANPSDLKAAGAAFERLIDDSQDDRAATAGLVASFATSDYAKVQPFLASLTPVDKLVAGIDVAALVEQGVATFPAPSSSVLAGKKRAADSEAAGASKPKKKRKRPLPKNYEEDRTPDPERWLPLRDRSTYRPKGKKGKKRAAEATQGGLPASMREEGETLELAGGAGSVKVEKAPAGGKKGKKKGKK